MARCIETSTWWQGDLLEVTHRPLPRHRRVTEGTHAEGKLTKIVRVVDQPQDGLTDLTPDYDFDFPRTLALVAMAHAAVVVMSSITPDDHVIHDEVAQYHVREATLSEGAGRAAQQLAQAPIAQGPARVVIPTPVGSRVNPIEPKLEIATAQPTPFVISDISVEPSGLAVSVGVLSGPHSLGSLGGIATIPEPRCHRLARHLTDQATKRTLHVFCRHASQQTLDCLSHVTATGEATREALQACR